MTEPQAETGFFVYRESDGSWTATTDMVPRDLQREAQAGDVKTGCREIFEAFAQNDLATAIAERINISLPSESETTAEAIRNALRDRNQSE